MWRVLVAGVMGGFAMFIWAAIAHLATPLAFVGVSSLPNEAAVIQTLKAGPGAHGGLYVFPAPNRDSRASRAQEEERLEALASGLIVYRPPGAAMLSPSQLATEAVLEIVEAIICAFLVRFLVFRAFLSRVAAVAGIGLVAVITTNGSYWNWYGFPTSYTLAYAFTQWVGFVLAGVMIALVYGWWRKKPD